MTMVLDSSYQQLNFSPRVEEGELDNEQETPRDPGVIIHVVPESGRSRWNHIEDLDSFFTRMYQYHQKHGFVCMIIQEVLELAQFVYVVFFSVFLLHCVDYSILFKDKLPDNNNNKTTLSDAILSTEQCLANFGLFTWLGIFISCIFWFLRFIKVLYHIIQFLDIKSFFNTALKIDDKDLDNLTWHEIQKKIIEVQKEQEMCIHKRDLTELDIYHRILRFKNYLVAMINKSLIPVHLNVPILGDTIFMTRAYKYNLELIFFRGPWSPFENSWHLKEDYKKLNKRQELARALSNYILWIGIFNFLLSPIICFWQVLYFFYTYVEMIKREPGSLGTRTWSLYGRLYLRHFNELDHELNARLNRAYRPAVKYMSMFTSPILTIISKNVAFVAGSILAVFVILALYDEDFLTVEHVLMISTLAGSIIAISRSLIPDENLVWCPESLLIAVLAHTHYRPDSWRNQAHTQATRAQMAQLFQYKAVHLLEELLSPIITPYILIFYLRHRALDIVDFFRNFTVEVTGVGDICSFAQMDVRKHGNPMWQTVAQSPVVTETVNDFENLGFEKKEKVMPLIANQCTQAEDGKTELSLIHFTLTNPEWKPPSHAENFVLALRERAKREATNGYFRDTNPLCVSLTSLSSLGPQYNGIVNNIIQNSVINQISMSSTSNTYGNHNQQVPEMSSNIVGEQNFSRNEYSNILRPEISKTVRCGVSKAEGPLQIGENSLLYGLQKAVGGSNQSLAASIFSSRPQDLNSNNAIPLELTTVDMSLSTLYLHELHHRQVQRRGIHDTYTRSIWQRSALQEFSTLPELGQERIPLLRGQASSNRNQNS